MKDVMDPAVKMIAVVQGAPGATVQDIFGRLIDRWRPSARVAGVIAESHGLADRACSAGFLRNIGTGELFPIFQDLGPRSTACHLDGASMLPAAEAVRQDIARGCDLVLLSKFGKLEAGNSGLVDAFRAAMEAHVPVLTSVSPAFEGAWAKFAAPLFVTLPPTPSKSTHGGRPFGHPSARWMALPSR
jgi:Protein of unknown function (DUF2478)